MGNLTSVPGTPGTHGAHGQPISATCPACECAACAAPAPPTPAGRVSLPKMIVYALFAVILILVAVVLALALAAGRGRAAVVGGGAFRLKVSDPEYTAMLDGKKTVEARLDAPPFDRLAVGDPVVVVRARPQGDTSEYPGGRYKFDAEVVRIDKYPSLDALLKAEGVGKVYPGKSASEAAERFEAYLPAGRTAADPVLAVEVRAAGGAKKAPAAAKKLAAGRAHHPKKAPADAPGAENGGAFDYGFGE